MMKKILSILFVNMLLFGCTDNYRAKTLGGTTTIRVKQGYKVTSATFKENNVWYFIEPMDSSYTPKNKELIESSNFGIMTGKIIFYETK